MGVRVRKLARELEVTPGQVLGLLEALGYQRYKSSDDMVSDTVAARLRQAARQGVTARPVADRAPARPAPRPAPSESGSDVMARLVPGVVKTGTAPNQYVPPAPPPEPAPEPPPPPEPVVERVVEPEALDAAREEITTLRAELEATRQAAEQGGSLLDLLEERGLRGLDEAERAIASLASAHVLGRLLRTLKPADPHALRRLLQDHLVLVGGPVPEGLDVPAVTVSEDRADVPSADRLARLTGRMGEQLLLSGYRRVLMVGVQPRWQQVVREGLDRRIEVSFRPGGPRDAARAADEAQDVDVVILWNVAVAEDALQAYTAARAHPVQVRADDLGSFLERVVTALSME